MKQKFENIYEENNDSIFRFCLVRVSNRDQALDITQEAFLRLWSSFLEGQEIENARAFLFTVTHNLIIDWYRKKKSISLEKIMNNNSGNINTLESYTGAGYDIAHESTEGIMLGAEGRFLLEKIDLLPDTYQHPVYLRFVEGLSPVEIGGILGISGNAASVRVNRGLTELRKLGGYHIDEGDI